MNECQALRPLVILAAVLLAGCPTRAGIQHGEGEQTAHERMSQVGARAFAIERADHLLTGMSAEGRVGDLRMENAEIVVIIGDIDHKSGFGASGGTILDASLKTSGADGLQQVLLYLDDTWPRQAAYRKLTILEAGGPGARAVIEVSGKDTQDPDVHITTRYILEPGGRALTLETVIENTGRLDEPAFELGDALQWGQARPFAPGLGHGLKGKKPRLAWMGAEAEGVSYGWVAQDGAPMTSIHGGGWSDLNVQTVHMKPGLRAIYKRHLVVGDGTLGSLLGPILSLSSQDSAEVSGRAEEGADKGGAPVPDALVEILDAQGNPYTTTRTDAEGRFSLPLPAAQDFLARATTRGRLSLGEPTRFKTTRELAPLALPLTRPGAITFELTDKRTGKPSPGKVILKGRQGTPDPDLGPAHLTSAARNRLYTLSGSGRVEIPPGLYTAYGARGPEFSLDTQDIEVKAGEVTPIKVAIERVLDTTGWLAGDFHQHSLRSTDSPTALSDRVISNIAEGVEILGSSDHNVVTDYGPTIEKLGVGHLIASVVGNEVTTARLGHFNAFPLQFAEDKPAGGALSPEGMSPGAIFDALRASPPTDKIIQINHPRTRHSGYFTAMGLDRATLKAEDERMSWAFDAIEIFNGRHVKDALDLMEDWFRMLDEGGLFVAMGNSDTHLVVGDEPGYARTMVYLGTDDPAAFEDSALVSALKGKRRAVVTNGPMIEMSLNGTPIGGFVPPSPGAPGILEIKVQAAPWISIDKIEVIARGEVIHKWEGLSSKITTLRLKESIEVSIDAPTWIVVRAMGSASMSPVVPGNVPAMAFTNPVWVGELVKEGEK